MPILATSSGQFTRWLKLLRRIALPFSEIMTPTDIARGASAVLGELGYYQVRALDEVYVRMPTPDEVHRLSLGPGTPVAVHLITGFTDAGQPVRVVINILPGDRHAIVWERERPAATP